MGEENNKTKTIISETIFLFIITTGTYWVAYRYEASYLSYYGIPHQFIDVSVNLLLATCFVVSSAFGLVFAFANLIAMFWPKNPIYQDKVFRLVIMLVLPTWHLLFGGFTKNNVITIFIIFGLFILFEIALPLLAQRDKKSVKEKFEAAIISNEETRSKTIIGRMQTIFGHSSYFLFLLLWLGGHMAGVAGVEMAKNQNKYYISTTDSCLVLIRAYHDMFVCARVNRNDSTVSSFVIKEPESVEYLETSFGKLKRKTSQF